MESESEGICVEAAELRAALRRLQRLGGKTPGPGIWRVRDGVLEVEWKGGSEGVDASGALRCSLRIAAEHMVVLARTLAETGTLRIRLRSDGRVAFGTYNIPYEPVADDERTDLLPVHATPYDVLMLGYRHRGDEIRNAGLDDDVEAARAKLEESIAAAAHALGWARISEELLRTWVDAHLVAVAAGRNTFEVSRAVLVDRDGQLGLFTED